MTGDSADYSADDCAGYGARGDPRVIAAVTLGGLADSEARARANKRADTGAGNGAPTQLALLRASADQQRDAGQRRQQNRG